MVSHSYKRRIFNFMRFTYETKTDRGRMKFRAFMVCVLSFLVVTGSVCFLNREQERKRN